MYHSSNTIFFSIHAGVCAPKSWKYTCLGFDPVTPLFTFVSLLLAWMLYFHVLLQKKGENWSKCYNHYGIYQTFLVVVIATAQLYLTKPELRFCASSNPACGVSEIHNGEDLWQWSWLEIRLNTFRQSTIPQKQFIIIIIIIIIPLRTMAKQCK